MLGRNKPAVKPDVIIPVYRPDIRLRFLVKRLEEQTVAPGRIIIMLTLDRGDSRLFVPEGCEVYTLPRRGYDHAGTRNLGAAYSESPYFIMMTQDAVPADRHLIENLMKGILEDGAAVSYGRQLAYRSSSFTEKLTRGFNYPEVSSVRTAEDIPSLGIKAFFCSNVCAAYDRDAFVQLGGFSAPAVFNEDMVYARSVLESGKSISYRADARVYHSHDYSVGRLFRRNFDLAASQRMHPEVFGDISSEGEGVKYVMRVTGKLAASGHVFSVLPFIFRCAVRYAAFFLGKRYNILPLPVILRCTDNPYFWKTQKRLEKENAGK